MRRSRAGAAALGDRLGPDELLDDGLLQPQAALAAHGEQLLRAAQVEDLGAVGGSQALDQERVAPGHADEGVRPGALRAKALLMDLDGAVGLDDARQVEAAAQDPPRRGAPRVPGVDHRSRPRGHGGPRRTSPRSNPRPPSTACRAAARKAGLAAVLDHHPPGAQAVEQPGTSGALLTTRSMRLTRVAVHPKAASVDLLSLRLRNSTLGVAAG